MSEPIQTQQQPDTAPPPEAPPQTQEMERAVSFAERAAGIKPEAAPETPPPTTEPARRPPIPAAAHTAFQERQRVRDLETVNQRLLSELEGLRRAIQGPQGQPAAEEPDDPEPDIATDPRAWYLWRDRQSTRALRQEMAPVLGFIQSEGQRRQQEAQAAFQRQQVEQATAQLRAVATEGENAYFAAAPDAAAGYHEDLHWYRDVLFKSYLHVGMAPEQAAGFVSQAFDNLVLTALRANMNPAAAVHAFIQGQRYGNGHGAPQAQEGPQAPAGAPIAPGAIHPEQQAIRELREAARAPVARSISQSSAAKGETAPTGKALVKNPNMADFERAVQARMKAEPGRSRRSITFQLMREAEESQPQVRR